MVGERSEKVEKRVKTNIEREKRQTRQTDRERERPRERERERRKKKKEKERKKIARTNKDGILKVKFI